MAWSDIVAAGGGDVEFRLVIEGCPFEFVTDETMVGDCTEAEQEGKRRVVGLIRDSIGFSESVYIPGAEIDVQIDGVRIAETPGVDEDAASRAFASEAENDVVGYLTAQLGEGAGDTTVTVGDTATGYVAIGDRLHIGSEVLRVTAIPTSTTLTVERGQWRTTRQRHSIAVGGEARYPELSTSPWRYRGRRCWLYAHTHDELAVGSTGTIVWRGIVGAEPRLDDAAVEWSFPVESRWTVLDAEVGAADAPIQLRGCYRPGQHPIAITVRRCATSSFGGTPDGEVTVAVAGFWETEEEYTAAICAALNANATIVSWGHTFSAGRSFYDDRWELIVTQPATPRYLEIWGGSRVDGSFTSRLYALSAGTGYAPLAGPFMHGVSGSTAYFVGWDAGSPGSYLESSLGDELRRFPSSINRPSHRISSDSDITSYPISRLYVSATGRLAAGDHLEIATSDEEGEEPITLEVATVDGAAGYVEVATSAATIGGLPIEASGAVQPEITAATVYEGSSASGTDLDGMIDEVISAGPAGASTGAVPLVLTDDIADWASAVTLAAFDDPRLNKRRWRFYKPVKLSDVVREECKLLGLFPYLNADAKIALRRLTVETSTSSSIVTIDEDAHVQGDGYGSVDYDVDGSINTVDFQRFYDPKEDKHSERGWVQVRSVPAIQRDGGVRRVLEIAPKSAPVSGEIDRDFCLARAQPVLHLFSGRLMEVRVQVTLAAFGVLCGDTVYLSIDQLPYRGVRRVHATTGGMRTVRAIVVGREWRLGSEAHGTLRCIVPGAGARAQGYAPTARITSAVNTSGTWELTCTQQRYGPSGSRDVSFFAVGDLVRIYQWDAATPAEHGAVVTAVDAGTNKLTVTAATFAGLGGNTWNVGYDTSSGNIGINSTQQGYAGIADAATLTFETADDPLLPDHYAP